MRWKACGDFWGIKVFNRCNGKLIDLFTFIWITFFKFFWREIWDTGGGFRQYPIIKKKLFCQKLNEYHIISLIIVLIDVNPWPIQVDLIYAK